MNTHPVISGCSGLVALCPPSLGSEVRGHPAEERIPHESAQTVSRSSVFTDMKDELMVKDCDALQNHPDDQHQMTLTRSP